MSSHAHRARVFGVGYSTRRAGFAPGYTWESQGRIAGRDGRYMVSFVSSSVRYFYGENLHVQRVDWPETGMTPTQVQCGRLPRTRRT